MKRLFQVILVIIILIIIAMLIIPFLFKGKVEDIVREQANKNLNARVDFSGIDISFFRKFPNVYLAINDLTISGNADFSQDTLADVSRFSAVANPVDFLRGDYVIKRISISNPKILLKVLNNGNENWDVQLPSDEPVDTATTGTSDFTLKLNRLVISDGFLVYEDQLTSTFLAFNGMDLNLSGELSSSTTSLRTSLSIVSGYVENEGITYLNDASILFNALIEADLEHDLYSLRKNELRVNDLAINLDGSVGLVGDDVNIMLTFNTPSNRFKDLLSLVPVIYRTDFESIEADGNFILKGFVKGVYSEDAMPSFRAELNLGNGRFKYPGLPAAVEGITIEGAVYNEGKTVDHTVVDLKKINLNILENQLDAYFFLERPVSDPFIKMRLDADVDLGRITSALPLETEGLSGNLRANLSLEGAVSAIEEGRYSDFSAMGSVMLREVSYPGVLSAPVMVQTAQLNFAPQYLDLVSFEGSSGRSDISLKGKVLNFIPYFFSDGTLGAELKMTSDTLDLNELLLADPSGEQTVTTEEGSMEVVEIPPNLDLAFTGDVGELIYGSLSLDDVRAKIIVKDRKINIEQLESGLFDGSLSMEGVYDAWDPGMPLVDFSLKLNDLNIKDAAEGFHLLAEYAPFAEKVMGDFSAEISIAALLRDNMLPVLSSITGKGFINTTPLGISGVNTLEMLSEELKIKELSELKTNPVKIDFQFIDGILNVQPFDLDYKGSRINLSGWTSFDREIAYTMKMALPRELLGQEASQFIAGLESKAGIADQESGGKYVNLSALIGGSLDNPNLTVGLAGVGEGLIREFREKAGEVIEQKTEETRQRAKAEADRIMAEAEQQALKLLREASIKADQIRNGASDLADETRKQSLEQASRLEAEAKDKGVLAVAAAKTAADQLRKEGDKQAQNIITEAGKKADDVLKEAEIQADKIREEARKRIEKL